MSVLTTPPDASERHRSEPALGERGHVIGNSATAGKVQSRPILLLIASSIALIAAIVVGVLGAFALWALWRYRRPAILPAMIVRATVVGAVVGAGLMAYTGLLGGQIRHTEVRPGYVPAAEGAAGAGGSSAER